jgi:hypothetical protein
MTDFGENSYKKYKVREEAGLARLCVPAYFTGSFCNEIFMEIVWYQCLPSTSCSQFARLAMEAIVRQTKFKAFYTDNELTETHWRLEERGYFQKGNDAVNRRGR